MSATPLVLVESVSYTYPNAASPVLQDLSFTLDAASFTLVVGRSGSGKSTMLRLLNGLVPHFTGGRFAGNVLVAGRDTRQNGPRDLASTVGFVFQDPEAQMLTDRVEDEIAFGMEQAGLPRSTMRKRVEEALDLLRIGHLRERSPATLSGGERQRVAIASAMVLHPQLLVLDEPTSQLDPWSADDVLTVVQRLNDDLGTTVLMAEHRLERTVPIADRLMILDDERRMTMGTTREMLVGLDTAALPPIARLGEAMGWHPTPLTVKEGRQSFNATYPTALELGRPIDSPTLAGDDARATYPFQAAFGRGRRTRRQGEDRAAIGLELERITVRRGGREVLRDCSLKVATGEFVALMGRNGSGKTSLLRVIAGLDQPASGRVTIPGGQRTGAIGYVPQQPAALLWHETVRDDIRFAMQSAGQHAGDIVDPDGFLGPLGIVDLAGRHPRDLSVGERVRAAIAVALAGDPRVLLLDEPTRGMDWEAKAMLMTLLKGLCADGVSVVVATHDVELMARWADRVVLLGDREIVAMGPPSEVLANSLTFSTQMNAIFGGSVLTVEDAVKTLSDQASPEVDRGS